MILLTAAETRGAESVCRGTTSNGALESGCRLPISGENFSSYSVLGGLLVDEEARARGVGIRRVIFDPGLRSNLHDTRAWPGLQGAVDFSDRPSWVRHDEHYHVDFEIECRPLRGE